MTEHCRERASLRSDVTINVKTVARYGSERRVREEK